MALAKVYDTETTIMIPLDADATESLSEYLFGAAYMVEYEGHAGSAQAAHALRLLGHAIDDARSAAGL